MIAKLLRFWKHGRAFRAHYGMLAGTRLQRRLSAIRWRTPAPAIVDVTLPDWEAPIALRAGTSDADVLTQVVVHDELEITLEAPPRRILDGGCNIGIASRVFARHWPDAEIVGVELDAGNLAMAARNCAAFPRITLRRAALWDGPGLVRVSDPGDGAWSLRAEAGGGDVPAIALGALFDELGWESVDLVKLDIEGAERRVLDDAPNWLPRVRHLLVELHDRFEPGCEAAFERALAGGAWSLRRSGEYLLASRTDR